MVQPSKKKKRRNIDFDWVTERTFQRESERTGIPFKQLVEKVLSEWALEARKEANNRMTEAIREMNENMTAEDWEKYDKALEQVREENLEAELEKEKRIAKILKED